MQLLQYTGPFDSGYRIELTPTMNYRYIHIGLQAPHRQPVAYVTDGPLSTELTINGDKYRISETDILEFDDMRQTSFEIVVNEALPWGSIIDVCYELQDD